MYWKYSLLFIVILIVLGSCNHRQEVITYYESGQIQQVTEIDQDSMKNGVFVRFAENGDTLELSHYENDKLEGVRKLYYANNLVEIIEHYNNDSLHGPYRVYNQDQSLLLEAEYEKNNVVGMITKYFPSGAIQEKVTYRENMENGPFTEFYENGQKKWEGTYKDGDNEYGLLIHYAENGDTIKKMMCDERFICRTIWQNEAYIDSE